jgi:hypothetical protein
VGLLVLVGVAEGDRVGGWLWLMGVEVGWVRGVLVGTGVGDGKAVTVWVGGFASGVD